ncbi:MAG: phospholipase C type enzyme [Thelocarpon superellum]|nr:MAG: phospholipase C type enzyme [Thelocarpon superellum]
MAIKEDTQLDILTLNCWGLKYLAKHRRARLAEIGAQIGSRSPPPSIVGLQECWTQEDYQSIRHQTKDVLPYGKFYYSGIFGGGLAILSKWPIEESSMVRYPLNGRPTAFFRGDWFVGKGVACARIRTGSSRQDVVEVFCTHLHAPYEREPHDSYLCHRTAQAWEIAKMMRGAAERGHLVVGLGDFNMLPLSLAHQLITTHAPVQDAWRVVHPDSAIGAAIDDAEQRRGRDVPSASFNLAENGATCDSILNTWRWNKGQQRKLGRGYDILIDPTTPDPRAKRLDYIFVGQDPASRLPWTIHDVRVGMTERHPRLKCSLSDHFSVEASLCRSPTADQPPRSTSPHSVSSPSSPPLSLLPRATYDEIMDIIRIYSLRQRRQRKLRVAHCLVQFVLAVACLVAVWWSPHNYVAFLLMLLCAVGLVAGVLDGLIGGLFVSSELRALKEFAWEIRAARDTVGPSP